MGLIITLIITAIVAAWFSLEAESRRQSKLFWISVGIFTYLIAGTLWSMALPFVLKPFFLDFLNRSSGESALMVGLLGGACGHSIGILVAAILRWQVSKKTGLEVRPPVLLIVFTVCVHIALVVSLMR